MNESFEEIALAADSIGLVSPLVDIILFLIGRPRVQKEEDREKETERGQKKRKKKRGKREAIAVRVLIGIKEGAVFTTSFSERPFFFFLFLFSFCFLFFFVQPDCACGLFGFCFFRSSRRRAPASFARRPTNRSCRRSAPNCWPLRFLSLDAMQKQKGKKKENSSGGGGGGPGSVHLLSKSAALGPTGSRPAAARRSRSQRQSVPE